MRNIFVTLCFLFLTISTYGQDYTLWVSGNGVEDRTGNDYSIRYQLVNHPIITTTEILGITFTGEVFNPTFDTGIHDIHISEFPLTANYRRVNHPNFVIFPDVVDCTDSGSFSIGKLETVMIGVPLNSTGKCEINEYPGYQTGIRIFQWAVVLPKYQQPINNERTYEDKLFESNLNSFTEASTDIEKVTWFYKKSTDFSFKAFPDEIKHEFPMNSTIGEILANELQNYSGNITIKATLAPGVSIPGSGFLFPAISMPVVDGNVIVVNVLQKSPELDASVNPNPAPIQPSCTGSNDGSFLVTFDRALETSTAEKMRIEIHKNTGVGPTGFEFLDSRVLLSTDWSSTSYRWDNTIEPGEYKIRWQTKEGGDSFSSIPDAFDESNTFTITDPVAVTFNATPNATNCAGTANGSITIVSQGGTGPYTYFLTPEGGTETEYMSSPIPNLPDGTYSLRVQDFNDCFSDPEPITILATSSAPTIVESETSRNQLNEAPLGTASITLGAISGGTNNLSYTWSRIPDNGFSETTRDLADLTEGGEYSVVITAGGCASIAYSFTIADIQPLTVSFSTIGEANCEGETARIQAQGVGGTGSYTYLWDNGATTASIDVAPGTYGVTVTDASTTAATDSFTLNYVSSIDGAIITNLLSVTVTSTTDILCQGDNTGAIELAPAGGLGNYEIYWDGSATGSPLNKTDFLAGEHFYVIRDRNGCEVTNFPANPITLTEPLVAFGVTATSTDASTNGGNQGTITLTLENGTGPYTYVWTKDTAAFTPPIGSTDTALVGLEAGEYQVLITDALGCVATLDQVVTIGEPGPLRINDPAALVTDVSCFDESTGRIDASYEGTAPFEFVWFDDAGVEFQRGPEDFIENQPAGTYSYTINDTSNAGPLASVAIIIAQPTAALAATFAQTEVTCFGGNDGTITVSATGGTAPLDYQLIGGLGLELTDGAFTNLEAGSYTVNVTDANNCSLAPIAFELDPPAQITFDDANAITPVSTPGGTDGRISVIVQGGAQPYFYRWTGPNGAVASIDTPPNTTEIENLPEGDYTLTVSNNAAFIPNGCFLTKQYTVTEQDAFAIQSFTGTDYCFGPATGTLTATIVATGPVTFNWFEINDTLTPVDTNTTLLRTLTTTGLGEGTYYLEIVDANGTTIRSANDFEIVELEEVSAVVTPVPTCNGEATGSITFSVPTGSPSGNYSYSIDDGFTFQPEPLFEGLANDIYIPRMRAFENPNCDFRAPGVRIDDSPILNWDIPIITRASGPNATDGSISTVFTGGTAPYTFVWNPNPTNSTTQTITGVGEGTYNLTITDASNCSISQDFEVTEVGPLSITNIVPTAVLCRGEANGSITTTVTGEDTINPINYLWTLTNGDPVPVSNGVNGPNITGIAGGNYILTVTDDNSTVTTPSITIAEPATTVTITNIIPNDVSCFGGNDGSLEIEAAGGTGPYTYSVNGGAFQDSPIFNTLISNNYTVRVRDANDCEFIEPIPIFIIDPDELSLIAIDQIPVTAANETDGSIFITAQGGSGNYTYQWEGPNGYTSIEEDISNLAAGNYIVTITDVNFTINNGAGCRLVSAPITVTEPGVLIANAIQTLFIECSGDDNAEITVNAVGGVLPYSYQWFQVSNGNNNTLLNEDTNMIGSLSRGEYFARVTDANSTTIDTNPVIINEPTQIQISIDNTIDVLCPGELTGAINITVTGGTPPYQYAWSNGATIPDISGLDTGDYIIEIRDASGCFASESTTITAPDNAVQIADVTINNVSAFQALDGSISLDVTGGVAPYTYVWTRFSDNSNAGNQATISNLAADSYTVVVSDANGCAITETYEITQPDIIDETIIQPSCTDESDGSISVLVNEGNGTFIYLWNDGSTENNINNLGAGSYSVIVTGLAEGPQTRNYVLENPVPLEVNLGLDRVLCADQVLELDGTVDDPTASYAWTSDNGFTSANAAVVLSQTGNYTLTVQSQTGCTTQGTIFVDVSTDVIDAEFAVSSQVFVGETIVAVDISFPLPDGIEWILPIGAQISTQDRDAVEFSFPEAGEYDITVITTRGECIAQKTKKILVVAKDGLIQEDDDATGQKLVEEFIVYPNPTSGRFTADINLTERGDVSVKVFSFSNNSLMASQKERGETSYSIPFDISGMPSGVYAVLLETPYGTSLRKIVVR